MNARKSKFLKDINGTPEKLDENSKENIERLKAIRRRHTLIGKKTFDDHDLAKIDLNCTSILIMKFEI